VEFLEMVAWGLIPLLILSTAAFGILLLSKVMEPLTHLKKQARKLTDNIATLQNELRLVQGPPAPAAEPAPALEPQVSPQAGTQDTGTQTP
jgi:hypothetical protein